MYSLKGKFLAKTFFFKSAVDSVASPFNYPNEIKISAENLCNTLSKNAYSF